MSAIVTAAVIGTVPSCSCCCDGKFVSPEALAKDKRYEARECSVSVDRNRVPRYRLFGGARSIH